MLFLIIDNTLMILKCKIKLFSINAGAAIGWSCSLFKTPYFGVKVVTDIVDGDRPTQDEFLENLSAAAKKLQESMPVVINHVCGKHHDEL